MDRVKQIYEFYKLYDDNFTNKKYIYYSKNNTLEIEFTNKNFAHLTGFDFYAGNRKLSATHVYKLLKNRRLNSRSIREKKDGSSRQKMQVYSQMKALKSKTNLIITNNEVIHLNLDGIIATNKKILAIGVRDKRPITLLNQKPNFNMGNFEKVTKIEVYDNMNKELVESIEL